MASNLDYYDITWSWDKEASDYTHPAEQARACRLARIIESEQPRHILDAGAGNGLVANRLHACGLRVVALDCSEVALTNVHAEQVVGDIADMPFDDGAFDLVLASEVLEHLPADVFERARSELARVAARSVVVTVPNGEDLFTTAVVCPACTARSSPWRHMRSFDAGSLGALLPGLKLRSVQTFGPKVEYQRRLEVLVKREVLGHRPWSPWAICPQCGYRVERPSEPPGQPTPPGALKRMRSALAAPLRRHVEKWILATFDHPAP